MSKQTSFVGCRHKCLLLFILQEYLFYLFIYFTGIMLEYEKSGKLKTKSIDLLDLSPR